MPSSPGSRSSLSGGPFPEQRCANAAGARIGAAAASASAAGTTVGSCDSAAADSGARSCSVSTCSSGSTRHRRSTREQWLTPEIAHRTTVGRDARRARPADPSPITPIFKRVSFLVSGVVPRNTDRQTSANLIALPEKFVAANVSSCIYAIAAHQEKRIRMRKKPGLIATGIVAALIGLRGATPRICFRGDH